MHPAKLPQYAIDGAVRRRGKVHCIEEIDPTKAALVVIDMQNVFMQENAPAEVPTAREIVPNINALARSIRETGGKIIWVQMTHSAQNLETWSFFYERISTPDRTRDMQSWMTKGTEGHKLWPSLDVNDSDFKVEKCRYSAFLQGSSNIAEVMRENALDTVVITGTLTNVCSESSARDAMMLNYKTIMVSDANAAPSDEEHLASLATFLQVFGDVYTTKEMIALLQKGKQTTKSGLAA